MTVLVKAAQLLLSLSLLVILHEFGHFIFAKIFKCRVEKFYLFFDPWFSLFKTKRGETEYGIGWLPLGGYVKIAGMIDESMDTEQMKLPPQPWEFRSKPAVQRLLIMLGGVLMNFIVALVIYSAILFTWGDSYLPTDNVKYGIEASELAKEIGFQNGDKILSVDGQHIESFYDIVSTIVLEEAKNVEVNRNDSIVNIPITIDDIAKMVKSESSFMGVRLPFDMTVSGFSKESPALEAGLEKGDKIIAVNGTEFKFFDEFSKVIKENKGTAVDISVMRGDQTLNFPLNVTEEGMIGISWQRNLGMFEFKTLKYGFFESIPAGIALGWETSVNYLKQFKLIFSRKTKGYESLGGFIAIGNIFPGVWDWHSFWNMTAFLSIILGIMNVLPIPALDGGHVLFVLYEIITRRKPSDKFLEYAQMVGLVLILLLVVYANANDIMRLFR